MIFLVESMLVVNFPDPIDSRSVLVNFACWLYWQNYRTFVESTIHPKLFMQGVTFEMLICSLLYFCWIVGKILSVNLHVRNNFFSMLPISTYTSLGYWVSFLVFFRTEGYNYRDFLWEASWSVDWRYNSIVSFWRECSVVFMLWRKNWNSDCREAWSTVKHMRIALLLCSTPSIQNKVIFWIPVQNSELISAADLYRGMFGFVIAGVTFF